MNEEEIHLSADFDNDVVVFKNNEYDNIIVDN